MIDKKSQSGMLLLEALIAVLVFSIGILGMVGLQAVSIKNTADATYRNEASYLANEIISQMWADRGNLTNYALNPSGTACGAGANTSSNAVVSGWLGDVGRLPGGNSVMHQIAVNANIVTVTVCWLPPHSAKPHNFIATTSIS